MSIVSVNFLILLLGTIVVFYLVPKKIQWMVLLIASIVFYYGLGIVAAAFVLGTATTIYISTRLMERLPKKAVSKKLIYYATILVNLGALILFKYFPLPESLVMPLGISFYTFQSIGYLTDVYHGGVTAEKNYFKTLLFVGFFPQMTQGPISDFKQLSTQIYGEHSFNYTNFQRGFTRMLWGFVKKIMIADRLWPFVETVFARYNEMAGLTVLLGAFTYSIQLYADFSGYMDIVCGACEMMDIRLAENFRQPYFSRSVAEYWRRWHITLGEWFKKYIYYPAAICKPNQFLGKKLRKINRKLSGNVVATLALLVTWAATGIWHGDTAGYIVWGLINGAFLIMSVWFENFYDRGKKLLHIKEDAWLWKGFTIVRTFFIVTLIKVLPEVGTLSDGFGLWKRIFTFSLPTSLGELLGSSYGVTVPLTTIGMMLLFFLISLISTKYDVRTLFGKLPWVLRIAVLAGIFILLIAIGIPENMVEGGFAYAKF